MLFALPVFQEDKNWLNSTLVDLLRAGMQEIDNGEAPVAWPDCLPNLLRPILSNRHGLRDRIEIFWTAYQELNDDQKARLRQAIDDQTNLPEIFGLPCNCETIVGLPDPVIEAAGQIFDFAFKQLKTLKLGGECIRDIQYKAIYDQLQEKICPFCGLNHFRAPGAPRHALDHYLPASRYTFAGSDFRNLVPCCHECNSDFKADQDLLFRDDGTRRQCSDPYVGPVYTVSLQGSRMFEGETVNGHRVPQWVIKFVGGPVAHAQTWDEIYRVKERFARDILNVCFIPWVEDFARYYVQHFGKADEVDEVYHSLPDYIAGLGLDQLRERAFLKTEVLRLIYNSCDDGENGKAARIWLWEFVEYGVT